MVRRAARFSDFPSQTSVVTAPTLFGPDVLPQLVTPIRSYIPPFETPPSPLDQATPLRRTLVSTDLEVFEESCSLLEALALDDEDVRLSLARGLAFPDEHGGVSCLAEILEFIDRGDYHPLWKDLPGDGAQRKRAFDFCKAALIKAVVEIAGEEKNVDVLWDDSDEKQPGGVLVGQMVQWIKLHKDLKDNNRDDLLVCATLTLGNLLRHGASYSPSLRRNLFEFVSQERTRSPLQAHLSASPPTLPHYYAQKLISKSSMELSACSSTSHIPHPLVCLSARLASSSDSSTPIYSSLPRIWRKWSRSTPLAL
jgi:hypothetical protein